LSVAVVGDDSAVVPRGTTELAAITGVKFGVGDNGTFGHLAYGHNVADFELSGFPAVDKLASVQPFYGNEVLFVEFVLVRVAENNAGKRGTTTRVVDDLLHNTLDVTMVLSEVESAELSSALSVLIVGLENTPRATLALRANDATHCD